MPNIEDKSLSDIKQGFRKTVTAVKTRKSIFKAIAVLKPALPFILLILAIVTVIFLVLLVVFWAAPQGKLYTTTAFTQEDDRLLVYYQKLTDENNRKDRWLVEGESSAKNTWYPKITSASGYINGGELLDRYGRDVALFETFGQIHAANLFYIISHQLKGTDDKFKARAASDLRPYLYYKESTVTVCCSCEGEECDPCSTTTVFLLVEAYTIQGHYLYEHEWVTEKSGDCTITYERPVGETQIQPNRWQRLDDWVEKNYKLNSPEDIEMLRTSVFEGAKGYTEFSEALEWLFSEDVDQFFVSKGFIPVQLLEHFIKACEAFGMPEWFLAALAFKESGFNPTAENPSGAYGLFQLMPATQKQEVDKLINKYPHLLPQALLDRYNASNKDASFYKEVVSDPYINTLCGALHLMGTGLNPSKIDWKSDNWKSQTLPYLAAYGGYYGGVPKSLWKKYNISSESEAKDKIHQWAKDEYASDIWKNAEKFSSQKGVWPTDKTQITAYFGQRGRYWENGHTGIDIEASLNTPVYAVINAEVTFAGWKGAYGKCVMISNGWYTFLYGHLDSIDVKAGDKVSAGKIIGRSGNTGNSSGPHLHFEVRNVDGVCIDPLTWLSF